MMLLSSLVGFIAGTYALDPATTHHNSFRVLVSLLLALTVPSLYWIFGPLILTEYIYSPMPSAIFYPFTVTRAFDCFGRCAYRPYFINLGSIQLTYGSGLSPTHIYLLVGDYMTVFAIAGWTLSYLITYLQHHTRTNPSESPENA